MSTPQTRLLTVPLILTVLAGTTLAAKKKPTGELKDRAAFANIKSYCIDLSGLEDYEVYDVRGFIDQESKPGKLLSKVPWKLDKDCRESDSDAIVKLEFPRLRVYSLGNGQPSSPGISGQIPPDSQTSPVAMSSGEPLYHTVAVLQVVSPDTSHLIYTCQADPLSPEGSDRGPVASADTLERHNAMYGAFWTLAQDIKRVSP